MKYIFCLLFTSTLFASENFKPILKEIELRDEMVDISVKCKSCEAKKKYSALKKEDVEKVSKHVFGGRTFGDQICLKIFKARVVSAYDKNENESHYCFFNDLSYISTDEINHLSLKLIK